MSPKYTVFESEKEAILLILTGIGDEIYSTVDTCKSSSDIVGSYQKAKTRHNGKETTKPITPPSELASEEDSNPEQAQKDTEMRRIWHHCKVFRRSTNTYNKQLRNFLNMPEKRMWILSMIQRWIIVWTVWESEDHDYGWGFRERNVVGSQKALKGLHDTDEEIDEQELEAHYSYMAKIQEVLMQIGTDS
ncbi:hypothetical protein Tco_1112595 [Tanacetum coccineum]|uniref:Uncharacterized protein n=1 Tax=Tanacetum coccineum TaxID=301880 RepID=A0ABQ5IPV6_9ASTR